MPSLIHCLHEWAKDSPNSKAHSAKVDGEWKTLTAKELDDRVFALTCYLESQNYGQGDCLSILSFNCSEWVQFDLAPHMIGMKSAGLYPNSSSDDMYFIIDNTESKVLVVQNEKAYKNLVGNKGDSGLPPKVKEVIVIQGSASFSDKAQTYDEVLQKGFELSKSKSYDEYLAKFDTSKGSFLIYTSGTTGRPKGVLLSHDNVCSASAFGFDVWKIPKDGGDLFSFLPLCHIAEKIQNMGVGITGRYHVRYASSIHNLAKELPEVSPTVLLCVPRLWEKFIEGVGSKLKSASPVQKALFKWAQSVGTQVSQEKLGGNSIGPILALKFKIADKLILSKLRKNIRKLSRTFWFNVTTFKKI